MIHEPFKIRIFRILWQLSGRRAKVGSFLTSLLKCRNYLPECNAEEVIPDFSTTEIRIQQCPLGAWSTPLVDVFVLLKTALGFHSKKILELGSYRGETARLIAQNTADDVKITAVDIDERHGAAYQGLDIARKTGRISPELFGIDEKYDLIFVDANHDFDSVMNDTGIAFKLLAHDGHDYAQDNYFGGLNGVPEALNHFSKTHAIYAIRGTRLAFFSNKKNQPKSVASKSANGTVWEERQIRG